MITPAEISEKARRLFPKFVKAWLAGEDFFPRRIPADLSLPHNLPDAKRAVDTLRNSAKQTRGQGYSIDWQSRRSRVHGLNEFPVVITLETQHDLLTLAAATSQFAVLESAVEAIRRHQPALEAWLQKSTHWKELLEAAAQLDDLLLVTQFLLDHPRPDCFAREIPLPISTKLIEENKRLLAAWLDLLLPAHQIDFRFPREAFAPRYGLQYARHHILLRVLDEVMQQQLGLRFAESSLPAQSIGQLLPVEPIVLVVENKVNLLTLPYVARGIAIGGLGRAISLLSEIAWLKEAAIFYWGDLDVEGFEILSQCRSMYPQTVSLMMDSNTLSIHRDLTIPWNNQSRASPSNLTPSEQAAWEHLLTHRLRLEQERIPQDTVVAALHTLGIEGSASQHVI